MANKRRTLYDKIVEAHTVRELGGEEVLLYIDLHIMNEYTSPQAFAGLREASRAVWRSGAHLAVVDHVNSTARKGAGLRDENAELLIRTLERNCREFGIRFYGLDDPRQGIEHVVVPEQGLALPGMVIACGDSHTTTYGAFGALGFGIGTSEVEHILATQALVYRRLRNMRVIVDGRLPPCTTAKDLIMALIRRIGVDGANGYAVEFDGEAIASLDMAGRMTVCNMALELGARAALIAPDDTVISYLESKPQAPQDGMKRRAREEWLLLRSDPDALFEKDLRFHAGEVAPLVSWGTSPDQTIPVTETIPAAAETADPNKRAAIEEALKYMGLRSGQPIKGVPISRAFIGSCTNSRIEDLRSAAQVVRGRCVAPA